MSEVADLPDLSALETIWADLRTLLEWQQGFGLYLVFAQDARTADVLLRSLTQWCEEHALPLQTVRPLQSEPAAEQVLAALHEETPDASAVTGRPLWLDLGDWSANPAWAKVRREILAALNQRRSWLEQQWRRPLFLHLPQSLAEQVVTWAPDLWSVKRYIAVLPAAAAMPALQSLIDAELALEDAGIDANIAQPTPDLPALAARYSMPAPAAGNLQALRDFALAIVESSALANDAASAELAAADSLTLFRQLRVAVGDTEQTLQDVANALNHAASKPAATPAQSRAWLLRAMGLQQRLLEKNADHPALLLQLAATAQKLAELERAAGNEKQALNWLETALPLQRKRVQMQDDIAAMQALHQALLNLADAQYQRGQIVLADEHRQEAGQLAELIRCEQDVRALERESGNDSGDESVADERGGREGGLRGVGQF